MICDNYIITKPTGRIRLRNPRRLFLNGYPWHGAVFTVGSGMMYSSLSSSLAAQTEATIHLLFPSAIQGALISSWPGTATYVKAVRPNSLLELSVWNVNNCFQCYQSNVFFEDVQIRCTYGNWSAAFYCNNNTNVIFNKCWINGSYHDYNYVIYAGNSFEQPTLYLKNCYLSQGYAHFANMTLSKTRVYRCQFNSGINYSSTNSSLAEVDYVTSSTIGYGTNYGSWMIHGVEDYCQFC